jgi:predicted GTPase
MKRVMILGAAGRDFHDFNVLFRNNPDYRVVAFTATQIPDIAGRRYPAALAGPWYSEGIPIIEEDLMEAVIRREKVDFCVFSYSDISHNTLMHLASRALAAGANFWLPGRETELKSELPVISICAVRTGCGKSPVSRRVAEDLRAMGWKPVVIRHPMPYGDLAKQAVQRFATIKDLHKHSCTIEECEEYEPHIAKGTVVFAGVDYEAILREAEKEGDIILWDGGNNDTPFYSPDLEIVVADPHRPGHEVTYFPGEVNFRRAQVIVINKVDTAPSDAVDIVRRNIEKCNPTATVVEAACRVSVTDPTIIRGSRVLVVEDGPTLTHGEMPYGAGVVAARHFGASDRVDPRAIAVGSIRQTFEKFPHIDRILPAMGYNETQRRELEETINRTPCDLVIVATPIDLGRVLRLNKPSVRVGYEIEEITKPSLLDVLTEFSHKMEERRSATV